MKYQEEYRESGIARGLIDRIHKLSRKEIRLMEVCGTHTVSIFRSGVRSVLPGNIRLLSGPGCPVCVTAQREIDAFIEMCRLPDVIVATFGDLMRVPGTVSTLQKERADGRDIRMVYSTMDALEIARKNPDKRVVFLGVGFETTAPTIAASILSARQMHLDNYLAYSAHKRVPPALTALLNTEQCEVDGFILPGHVSVIIGTQAYRPVFEQYRIPCAVTGFEPADILQGILCLVEQIEEGSPRLANVYGRAVVAEGNQKALALLDEVFEPVDAVWRGIGPIPLSGLKIRDAFQAHDAEKQLAFTVPLSEEPRGCACGDILTGARTPPECPLYRTICSPTDPVGPCMVSSEGTCAAYYRYHAE